jgi:hypothetical protein
VNKKNIRRMLQLSMIAALGTVVYISASAQTSQPTTPSSTAKSASAKPWKPKLLSDGQPDIEGTWTTDYYGMGCLTNPTNADVNCIPPPGPRPAPGTPNAAGPPPPDANGHTLGLRGNGNPPNINDGQPDPAPRGGGRGAGATDRDASPAAGGGGRARRVRNAPSRIIDTDNYDIPYKPEAAAHEKELFAHYYDPIGYGDIDPQQRCWPLGAVRQLTWQSFTFEQFPGYVLMVFGGGEIYRIIYIDSNRPHIDNDLKLWMGDSRGHWEGTTLVVDTASNNAKGRLSRAGDFSSDHVHYSERFIFSDANHFKYEAKFDDPAVYTRPWTFGLTEHRGDLGAAAGGTGTGAPQELWEEACHEGLIPGGNTVPGLSPID